MKFKKNELVAFMDNDLDEESLKLYPFQPNEVVVFLGEIKQMPGHCIVAKKDGRVIWGYDVDNFRKVKKDEV